MASPQDKALSGKNSYLSRERKVNANFLREKGYGDVLATRKSIGRHGKASR